MKIKKVVNMFVLAVVLFAGVYWFATIPPSYIEIAPPRLMVDSLDSIERVKEENEAFTSRISVGALDLPGTDEFIVQEHLGRGFATAMDGWIWRVDLETNKAERFVDVPLMAAGAVSVPNTDDEIYFCSSYLSGETYPEDEKVGLYKLTISTKQVSLLVDRVPNPPEVKPKSGIVYPFGEMPSIRLAAMNGQNSRPLAFCNDLAVHSNGKRIYFTEPFDYENASMGGGAFREAISLGRNGRLWMLDIEEQQVKLVAQNFVFIDGILIEEESETLEQSVLITETVNFRILRFFLSGEKAGNSEVLWYSLPGLPDGLDRDANGNIWVGIVKTRSPTLSWIHANPWIKPLMLRLPHDLLPVPKGTGVLALNSDASKALYYAEHKQNPGHISVVVPGEKNLYFPNFDKESRGLFSMPNPL